MLMFFFWCQTLKVLTHQQSEKAAVILSPVLNFAVKTKKKQKGERPLTDQSDVGTSMTR